MCRNGRRKGVAAVMKDERKMDEAMKQRLMQDLTGEKVRQQLLNIAAYESVEDGIRQGWTMRLTVGRFLPKRYLIGFAANMTYHVDFSVQQALYLPSYIRSG
jgi:hypothetical protein